VLGHDISSTPASEITGIHLADLEPDDPLTTSWQVLAMSSTMSIGLLAWEIDADEGSLLDDMERRFRYQFISESKDVDAAVRSLLRYF